MCNIPSESGQAISSLKDSTREGFLDFNAIVNGSYLNMLSEVIIQLAPLATFSDS